MALERRVHTLFIVVGFEIINLMFQVNGVPKLNRVKILMANRSDESFNKWTGNRNVWNRFNLYHLQNTEVRLPAVETIKRIICLY